MTRVLAWLDPAETGRGQSRRASGDLSVVVPFRRVQGATPQNAAPALALRAHSYPRRTRACRSPGAHAAQGALPNRCMSQGRLRCRPTTMIDRRDSAAGNPAMWCTSDRGLSRVVKSMAMRRDSADGACSWRRRRMTPCGPSIRPVVRCRGTPGGHSRMCDHRMQVALPQRCAGRASRRVESPWGGLPSAHAWAI